MPTTHTDIWKLAERQLGIRIDEGVRRFCEQMEYINDFVESPEENAKTIVDVVRCLQANGCYPAPHDKTVLPAAVPDDERWRLLAALGQRFDVKFSDQPVSKEYHGFLPMTVRHYRDDSSYPSSQRIEIDFDSRMSLTTVLASIRREWTNRFKPQGWVTPARQQGERALALVRYVCLESPDSATWRERLEGWNQRYAEWSFRDVRAFQGAVRRAEKQLVGQPKGLLPLYSTKAAEKKRDQQWRQQHLARIRARGQTREQLIEEDEAL